MRKHGSKDNEEDSDWDKDEPMNLWSLSLKMLPYRHPQKMPPYWHPQKTLWTNQWWVPVPVHLSEASVGTESQDCGPDPHRG